MIEWLKKIAGQHDAPAATQFGEDNPELAVIPLSGVVGAVAARQSKKRPIADVLRGGLTGLATGTGIVGGAHVGRGLAQDPLAGTLGGGAVGGLLSFLAAQRALRGMTDDTTKREKRSISPVLQQLIDAKQMSDRRDYKGKHKRLRELIEKYPNDFFIDSSANGIVGITHRPTTFRFHAPIRVLPVQLQGIPNVEPNNH